MERMEEKRLPRSYKIRHTPYRDAIVRAWDEKTTLAKVIETFVEDYAKGRKKKNPKKWFIYSKTKKQKNTIGYQ